MCCLTHLTLRCGLLQDATKCVEGAPFGTMRGYDFRIYPHLGADAKHEPGQVPCSINKQKLP